MCAFLPLNYLDSRHNVSPTFHFSACMCLEVYQFFKSAWIGEEVVEACFGSLQISSGRVLKWSKQQQWHTILHVGGLYLDEKKFFFLFVPKKKRNCHIIFSRSPRPFIVPTATTFLGWTIMYVRLLNFYGTFFGLRLAEWARMHDIIVQFPSSSLCNVVRHENAVFIHISTVQIFALLL